MAAPSACFREDAVDCVPIFRVLELDVRPRVRVVAAGGTIATTAIGGSGLVEPALGAEAVIRAVPEVEELASIEVEDFSEALSSQLSVEQVYELARRIRSLLANDPEMAGIVVTHGTGTLEESSFMADLLVDDPRPVVFTGAMRSGLGRFTDGPLNLLDAVRIAASGAGRDKGVLVAMNGVIHAAREARKAHTTSTDAFTSGEFGPLGYVYPDRVHFARAPLLRQRLPVERPVFEVDLIKFVVGMDDRYVRASVECGAVGLVVEGSGLGNVNRPMADGIAHALDQGVVVAICSRAVDGRTFPYYDARAGGGALAKRGCLLASLPGLKTRILLMLALGITRDATELQHLLDPASERECARAWS